MTLTASGVSALSQRKLGRYRLGDWLALALIVAVAVATRLTYLNLVEFKDDEAKVAGLAVAFLQGKGLPLIGIISSVGVNNPPAYVYLMSIPLAISHDPAVATGFVGLLGVGAVLLCYRLGEEIFDRRTAQVAALLYAAAPWGVLFSRKMQAQDVVPFFVLLFVGALYRFARDGRGRQLVLAVLWLNVLIQLHFGALALVPLVGIVALLNWRRLRIAPISCAAVLSGALWAPYFVYQLTHDWVDVRAALHVGRGAVQYSLSHFHWIVDLAASNAYWGLAGPTFDALYVVEQVLFYAGVALLVWLVIRTLRTNRADQRYLILALWLAIPPVFWIRQSTPLFPHYFQVVVPAQFVVVGLLFSVAERWAKRALPPSPAGKGARGLGPLAPSLATSLGTLVLFAIVATQTYSYFAWMRQIDAGQLPPGYGAPLGQEKMAVAQTIALAAGSDRAVYLAAGNDDLRSALEYLFAGRLDLKGFDGQDTLLAPPADGDTLYLISNPNRFAGTLLHSVLPDRLVATVPPSGDDRPFAVYRLQPSDAQALEARWESHPLDRTLPNGLRFLGYGVPPTMAAGGTATATLYWEVVTPPAKDEDYGFFFHLVDEQGRAWAKVDGLSYPPIAWKAGDVVATGATLDCPSDTPPGRYWVEVGVYHRPDLTHLPQRAPDGSTSDRARLGPVKLTSAQAAAAPAHSQPARFGDAIDLLGYDLAAATVAPGGKVDLALTWQAAKTPDFDYSTFIHLVDSSGKLVAQSDGQPGPYPATLLAPGERVRDARSIALPANLPPGTYHLLVGLYRYDTGARLPVAGSDHLTLDTPVEVR